MIDWIKITLRDFTGTLDNCRKGAVLADEETGLMYENYTLSNGLKTPKQHRLKIARQVGSSTLTVKGSIRKWGTHRDILADLSAKHFEKTVRKLADKLHISFEEICSARFTQCEIGLNIKTRIPCYEIIPMVVKYGGVKKSIEGDSVYFEGEAKKLKIYDKGKEVADNAEGANNRRMMKRISDWLRKNGHHYLRIEYTLHHHKGFIQYGLGHIETVGDLITHYSDLYTFWCRETNRITLYNPATVPNKEKLKAAEFKIAMNLAVEGYQKTLDQINHQYKNAKSANQMRSRARQKILAVVNKFYPDTYNTQTLRLDAARNLSRKHAKLGVEVPISDCYKALWVEKIGKKRASH